MQFNFKPVSPGERWTGVKEGIVRINLSSMVIAHDIIKALNPNEGDGTRIDDRVRLAILVDKDNSALQVKADKGGYLFVLNTRGAATINMPTSFKNLKLERGEYVRFDEGEYADSFIFVHQDKIESLAESAAQEQEIEPHEGARVTFLIKPKKGDGPAFVSEGTILRIYSTARKGHEQMVASINVTDTKYRQLFPRRSQTSISLDKLTVIQSAKEKTRV